MNIDLTAWSPYLVLAYILIKEIVPLIFPSISKSLSKRISTEDRLFRLVEENVKVNTELVGAIRELNHSLMDLHERVVGIENIINNANSVINKLILP